MLSRPEYQPAEPGLVQRVLGEVDRWIGSLLQQALGGDVSQGLALAGLVALVLVGVAVLAALVRSTRRTAAGRAAAADPAEVGRWAADWRAEAERAEQAGRWPAALRCWYRLTVAGLAAAGLADERPGATAGEDLAAVRARAPQAAAAFTELTDAFEQAWYGQEPVGPAEVAAVQAAAEQALAAARRPRSRHAPAATGSG